MFGKLLDKLYGCYGILIVLSFFLLPTLAWGWWGLMFAVIVFFLLGYLEVIFGVPMEIGLVVLTSLGSVGLFQALNTFFSFILPFVPYGVVLCYILIIIVMYQTPKPAVDAREC